MEKCVTPDSITTVRSLTDKNMVKSSLQKVASEANVRETMSGSKRLTEEDIDMVDLLYTYCRNFFDPDAWAAFSHNAKGTSNLTTDLIFPLYAEAADGVLVVILSGTNTDQQRKCQSEH